MNELYSLHRGDAPLLISIQEGRTANASVQAAIERGSRKWLYVDR